MFEIDWECVSFVSAILGVSIAFSIVNLLLLLIEWCKKKEKKEEKQGQSQTENNVKITQPQNVNSPEKAMDALIYLSQRTKKNDNASIGISMTKTGADFFSRNQSFVIFLALLGKSIYTGTHNCA